MSKAADQKIRDLAKNGPLTSRQMLEAEYGTLALLRNREAKTDDRTFRIVSFLDDRDKNLWKKFKVAATVGGYVKTQPNGNNKQDIHLNYPLLAATPYIIPAIFALGICFSIKNFLALGLVSAIRYLPSVPIFMTSLRTYILGMPFSFFRKELADVAGHEHIHVLQVGDKRRSGPEEFRILLSPFSDRARGNMKGPYSFFDSFNYAFSFGMTRYFMKDSEVQARLHTVMVHGFRKWGRLPENKRELWAALIDSGLLAPARIHEELKSIPADTELETFATTKNDSALKKCFNRNASLPVSELNIACKAHLQKDLKERFWLETLPYLYGHLLELYGYEDGRRMMGYRKKFDSLLNAPTLLLPEDGQRQLTVMENIDLDSESIAAREREALRQDVIAERVDIFSFLEERMAAISPSGPGPSP